MDAVVVLARRRLGVHHGHQWGDFAELAAKVAFTLAFVFVDAVNARPTVLQFRDYKRNLGTMRA